MSWLSVLNSAIARAPSGTSQDDAVRQIQNQTPSDQQVQAQAQQLSVQQIEQTLHEILDKMMESELKYLQSKDEKYFAMHGVVTSGLISTVNGYLKKHGDYLAAWKAGRATEHFDALFHQYGQWLQGDLSQGLRSLAATFQHMAETYCSTLGHTRGQGKLQSLLGRADPVVTQCRDMVVGWWEAYSFQLLKMCDIVRKQGGGFPYVEQMEYLRTKFLNPLTCSLLFVTKEYTDTNFPRCTTLNGETSSTASVSPSDSVARSAPEEGHKSWRERLFGDRKADVKGAAPSESKIKPPPPPPPPKSKSKPPVAAPRPLPSKPTDKPVPPPLPPKTKSAPPPLPPKPKPPPLPPKPKSKPTPPPPKAKSKPTPPPPKAKSKPTPPPLPPKPKQAGESEIKMGGDRLELLNMWDLAMERHYLEIKEPNRDALLSAYCELAHEMQRYAVMPPPTNGLRLLSINTHYSFRPFRPSARHVDQSHIQRLVKHLQPSICGLQEVAKGGGLTLEQLLSAFSMAAVASCRASDVAGGLSNVLLTTPTLHANMIGSVDLHQNLEPSFQVSEGRCAAYAVFPLPTGGTNHAQNLYVYNTHLDVWDKTGQLRLHEAKRLLDHIASVIGDGQDPVIVMGDLNETDGRDCTPLHREWLQSLRGQEDQALQLFYRSGFVDAAQLIGTRLPITVWSGKRVDYILCKNVAATRIERVFVIPSLLSDHFWLGVDVRI